MAYREWIGADWAAVAEEALNHLRGPVVAISGGGTYSRLFSLWRHRERLRQVRFFPVDERRVPFEHHDSNWGRAWKELFDPLGMPEAREHFAASAAQYERLLRERVGAMPVFDQVFLGVGEDGHTASLFPGGDYLEDFRSLVLETNSPKPPVARISLGMGVIRAARKLVMVVLGSEKSLVLARMRAGRRELPGERALADHPSSIVLADASAAEGAPGLSSPEHI